MKVQRDSYEDYPSTSEAISSTDHHSSPGKTAAEPLPNKTNYDTIGENTAVPQSGWRLLLHP